jgi:hypothetical protein
LKRRFVRFFALFGYSISIHPRSRAFSTVETWLPSTRLFASSALQKAQGRKGGVASTVSADGFRNVASSTTTFCLPPLAASASAVYKEGEEGDCLWSKPAGEEERVESA